MTSSIDVKTVENSLYHGAVISALAVGYAAVGKSLFKTSIAKLDFNYKDMAMMAVDISLAVFTRDLLVKKGVLPNNIVS